MTEQQRTLSAAVEVVGRAPLVSIPPAQAERIRRRIVDGEGLTPQLDVAAFNSAP